MTLLTTMPVTGSNLYHAKYEKPARKAGFFDWTDMSKYILSEIFTLVPAEVYTPETAREALAGQFPLNGDVQVQAVALEKEGAMVVYPSNAQMEGAVPFAVRLMEEDAKLVKRLSLLISKDVTVQCIGDVEEAFEAAQTADYKVVMKWNI